MCTTMIYVTKIDPKKVGSIGKLESEIPAEDPTAAHSSSSLDSKVNKNSADVRATGRAASKQQHSRNPIDCNNKCPMRSRL